MAAPTVAGRPRAQIELARSFGQIRDDRMRAALSGLVRTVAERQA
jgi:hypothetical protein